MGGHQQHHRRRQQRREHAEHENVGLVRVEFNIHNLATNRRRDAGAQKVGSEKFKDAGHTNGLFERQALARNTRRERVGDIIGANAKGVNKARNTTANGNPQVLFRSFRHD